MKPDGRNIAYRNVEILYLTIGSIIFPSPSTAFLISRVVIIDAISNQMEDSIRSAPGQHLAKYTSTSPRTVIAKECSSSTESETYFRGSCFDLRPGSTRVSAKRPGSNILGLGKSDSSLSIDLSSSENPFMEGSTYHTIPYVYNDWEAPKSVWTSLGR